MPIEITDFDLYRRLLLDRISIYIHDTLPRDTVILIGHQSATIAVGGELTTFEWDSARLAPHGLILDGLHKADRRGEG